jgi:hypothetical protein
MSNPSRIAMLAQIRSDVVADLTAADTVSDRGRNPFAQAIVDRRCRESEALSCLILAQTPTDLSDVVAVMLAMSEVSDAVQDHACGDAPNTDRVQELAQLVELAAGNVALFLSRTTPAVNAYDQNLLRSLSARLDVVAHSNGGEA